MADQNISIPAQGTTLEIEDAVTPATWYEVKGILTYSRAEAAAAVNDESTLASSYKEKSMGLPDAGQLTGTIQHNRADAGQAEMQAAKSASALRNFKLTLSDGSVEAFSGYVLNMPFSGNIGQRNDGQFSIEITGEPVWS